MFLAGVLKNCVNDHSNLDLSALVSSMADVLISRNSKCYLRDLPDICMMANHGPAAGEDDFILAYSGQFFNFRELKKSLSLEDGAPDEVVLKVSYLKWGADFVKHISGEFIVAIYDKQKEDLLLFRDKVGLQPMYYVQDTNGFIFGSEVKALLQAMDLRHVNHASLHGNILLYSVFTCEHLFEGIYELRAGHWLKINRKSHKINISKYWDREFNVVDYSQQECAAGFRQVLNQAIRRRLPAPMDKVGVAVSGGIDSTLVTALLKEIWKGQIDSYIVVADGDKESEVEDARLMAREFNTRHHEIIVTARKALEIIPKIIWSLGEIPFVQNFMNIGVQTYFVGLEAQKDGCLNIFTGNAVEQNFDGNEPQRRVYEYYSRSNQYPVFLRDGLLAHLIPEKGKRFLESKYFYPWSTQESRRLEEKFIAFNSNWRRESNLKKFYSEGMNKKLRTYGITSEFVQYFKECGAQDYYNKLAYIEFKTGNSRRNLVMNERIFGAFGIQCQIPFLDVDLVQFSSAMPINFKYNFKDAKYFLRKVYQNSGYLPLEIYNKGKKASVPRFDYWMPEELEVMLFFVGKLRKRDIFHAKHIERLLLKSRGRLTRKDQYFIFGFFVLEVWFRIYVDCVQIKEDQLTLEYLSRTA